MFNILNIMILICISLISSSLFAQTNENNKTSKNIIILNFVNVQDDKDFAYLSQAIPDAIKSPLTNVQGYTLIKGSDVKDYIEKKAIDTNTLADENVCLNIAKAFDADIIVYGKYIVADNKIKIFTMAMDVKIEKVKVNINKNLDRDVDMFSEIDAIAEEFSVQIKKIIPPTKVIIKEVVKTKTEIKEKITDKTNRELIDIEVELHNLIFPVTPIKLMNIKQKLQKSQNQAERES